MPKKTARQDKKYENFLNGKPVLELVEMIMYLDGIKPYVELSKNGEVGEFLQKRDYPIQNASDFNSFYETLKERIAGMEDKRVLTYFQRAEYQRQLAEIPYLLNGLEKRFEELETPFTAIIEQVYDAVMNSGFTMKDDSLVIRKQEDCVTIILDKNINQDENRTGRTTFNVKKIKKKLKTSLYRVVGTEIGECYFTPKETLSRLPRYFLSLTEDKIEMFSFHLKKFFSLPTIMNYYLKRRTASLDDCLKE